MQRIMLCTSVFLQVGIATGSLYNNVVCIVLNRSVIITLRFFSDLEKEKPTKYCMYTDEHIEYTRCKFFCIWANDVEKIVFTFFFHIIPLFTSIFQHYYNVPKFLFECYYFGIYLWNTCKLWFFMCVVIFSLYFRFQSFGTFHLMPIVFIKVTWCEPFNPYWWWLSHHLLKFFALTKLTHSVSLTLAPYRIDFLIKK